MYADKITPSMAQAIDETNRRRAKQVAYNTRARRRPAAAAQEDRRHHRPAAPARTPTPRRCSAGPAARSRAARRPVPGLGSRGGGDAGRHAAGWPACRRPSWPTLIQQLQRPDARGGGRAAVRAGGPAARRDRRAEEGAARHGGRGARVMDPRSLADGSRCAATVLPSANPVPGWTSPGRATTSSRSGTKIFAFLGGTEAVGLKCGRSRDEADEWLHRYPDSARILAVHRAVRLERADGRRRRSPTRRSSRPSTRRTTRWWPDCRAPSARTSRVGWESSRRGVSPQRRPRHHGPARRPRGAGRPGQH